MGVLSYAILQRDIVCPSIQEMDAGREQEPVSWDSLAEAVREGLITPATIPPGDLPPRKRIVPFEDLMDELQRDREDR